MTARPRAGAGTRAPAEESGAVAVRGEEEAGDGEDIS